MQILFVKLYYFDVCILGKGEVQLNKMKSLNLLKFSGKVRCRSTNSRTPGNSVYDLKHIILILCH